MNRHTTVTGQPRPQIVNADIDVIAQAHFGDCLLYTSPSPRDRTRSRMPSSAWKKKTQANETNQLQTTPTKIQNQHNKTEQYQLNQQVEQLN